MLLVVRMPWGIFIGILSLSECILFLLMVVAAAFVVVYIILCIYTCV